MDVDVYVKSRINFALFTGSRSVYNYCTMSRMSHNASRGKPSGATFVGEELYYRLVDFLKRRMKTILKVCFTVFLII